MLTICPTPIGNLDDATPRQIEALATAHVIACEDTRTTGKLLGLLGIERVDGVPALVSYHDHNATERVAGLIDRMHQGQRVTLVSDAGTPTISDPGFKLVRACADAGIPVTALPGPVAALVALSASGLPTDRFFFEGFLPPKERARRDRLRLLRELQVTVMLYESPHRITRAVSDIAEVFGDAHLVCLGRELTKKHEEYLRGGAREVEQTLTARDRQRGEFVVIIAPGAPSATDAALEGDTLDAAIRERLAQRMRTKHIRDELSDRTTLSSSELYDLIERIKKEDR